MEERRSRPRQRSGLTCLPEGYFTALGWSRALTSTPRGIFLLPPRRQLHTEVAAEFGPLHLLPSVMPSLRSILRGAAVHGPANVATRARSFGI